MRLRPGTRVLWRAPGEVQIGTDPRWSLRYTGLSAAEERALTLLEIGTWRATRVTPAPEGVTAARWAELLAPLHRADLLLDPREPPPTPVPPVQERTVAVVGLGAIGLGVALTLAAVGTGELLLLDDAPVRPGDVGPTGYRPGDVGQPRDRVAARLAGDIAPGTAVRPASRGPLGRHPDVVVLVERHVASPVRSRTLMAHGTWHLSVVLREADVVVGPFVVPGTSPCLRCLDLHRTDADERWPVVATQLACPPRHHPGRPLPAAVAVTAAGLAAGQVVGAAQWADGGPAPVTLGGSFDVDGDSGTATLRTWTTHPECGCTGLGVPASAPVV